MDHLPTVGNLKCTIKAVHIKYFGGQKEGSSKPSRTPPAYGPGFVLVSGAVAVRCAAFGRGVGPIHLDSVFCMGNESRLADCQHLDTTNYYCSHYQDAGVVCSSEYNNTCIHKHT